jgi:hypothetical protein
LKPIIFFEKESTMRKSYVVAAFVLLVVVCTGLVMANKANEGDEFCITISPNTLALSSEDTIVTVHSNIPYSSVNTVGLTLNNITATFSKADACGDLVVKFGRADVKGIVEPGIATLTLSGELKDGSDFAVSDTITVKE